MNSSGGADGRAHLSCDPCPGRPPKCNDPRISVKPHFIPPACLRLTAAAILDRGPPPEIQGHPAMRPRPSPAPSERGACGWRQQRAPSDGRAISGKRHEPTGGPSFMAAQESATEDLEAGMLRNQHLISKSPPCLRKVTPSLLGQSTLEAQSSLARRLERR